MAQSSRQTVLVVEDEGLVRLCAAESLRDAGFDVVEAADGEEALRAVEERCDIDILFTDIDMPGAIDGLELARRIHARDPHVRLIITSGACKPAPGDIPDAGSFVRKPYCPAAVASALRRMMG